MYINCKTYLSLHLRYFRYRRAGPGGRGSRGYRAGADQYQLYGRRLDFLKYCQEQI